MTSGAGLEQTGRDEIESFVRQVLAADALPRWWDTPIPRLHNATGNQMMAAGDGDKLLAYVKTYIDPSFS